MENPEKQAHKPKKMGWNCPLLPRIKLSFFILQLHVLALYGPDFVTRISELQIKRIFDHFHCCEKKIL